MASRISYKNIWRSGGVSVSERRGTMPRDERERSVHRSDSVRPIDWPPVTPPYQRAWPLSTVGATRAPSPSPDNWSHCLTVLDILPPRHREHLRTLRFVATETGHARTIENMNLSPIILRLWLSICPTDIISRDGPGMADDALVCRRKSPKVPRKRPLVRRRGTRVNYGGRYATYFEVYG